jgi:hypothetical protein
VGTELLECSYWELIGTSSDALGLVLRR